MFDFGFFELLVIGLIALIVVGPERLPKLMRGVGLWVGRARATVNSIRTEVEREINADGLRETQRSLREKVAETEREVNSAVDIGAPMHVGENPVPASEAPVESPEAAGETAADASPPATGDADSGSESTAGLRSDGRAAASEAAAPNRSKREAASPQPPRGGDSE